MATGFDTLDRHLSGDGWPCGGITEILSQDRGMSALALLLPALVASVSEDNNIFLVAPPLIPYAPGFSARDVMPSRLLWVQPRSATDLLWALEQILMAGCGVALAWPGKLKPVQLRRLQLAAERGGKPGFLFRGLEAADESSPAALRLRVSGGGREIDILKRRGGWPLSGLKLQIP